MVLLTEVLDSKGRGSWRQTSEHLGPNMQEEGITLVLEGSEERSKGLARTWLWASAGCHRGPTAVFFS